MSDEVLSWTNLVCCKEDEAVDKLLTVIFRPHLLFPSSSDLPDNLLEKGKILMVTSHTLLFLNFSRS